MLVGVVVGGNEAVIGEKILGSQSGRREVVSESGLDGQGKGRNVAVSIG
jgi:hypothetical protein